MCKPIDCPVCGKTTWKGCGLHIDSVKVQVPADQWCDGVHAEGGAWAAENRPNS